MGTLKWWIDTPLLTCIGASRKFYAKSVCCFLLLLLFFLMTKTNNYKLYFLLSFDYWIFLICQAMAQIGRKNTH